MIPKAYNINENLQQYPRIQDSKIKHDTRYNPNKYISIQTRVNEDANFEKRYIQKIASDGWVSLSKPEDLLYFPKGRLFKYRLNSDSISGAPDGTFRSGGWLIGRNMDDLENNNKYILYKGYNGAIFSLQIKDILEVYIQSKKREIPVFKKPDINIENKKYPVYLPDPNTQENILVYYARDNFAKRRFINSEKYKMALMLGMWSWAATFNEDNI